MFDGIIVARRFCDAIDSTFLPSPEVTESKPSTNPSGTPAIIQSHEALQAYLGAVDPEAKAAFERIARKKD